MITVVGQIKRDIVEKKLAETVGKRLSTINYTVNELIMKKMMGLEESAYVYGGISGYLFSLLTVQAHLRGLIADQSFKDDKAVTKEKA